MRTSAIIVGTDGTEASGPAVRWAAREAARRNLPLRVAHAAGRGRRDGRHEGGAGSLDVTRHLGSAVTGTARARARVAIATVGVEEVSLIGEPVPRLLEVAHDAELLVLGGHGRGGFASLLLGSVARRVAAHAACPVVIVRGRGDVTEGPVVVEVDETPYAEDLLAAAFELAADRHCGLVAVRTYLLPLPAWLGGSDPLGEADTVEHARLESLVAPWRDKFPEVAAATLVSPDAPAAVLVAASHTAQLIVVGATGHGEGPRTLRDSPLLHLLHQAECPVLVHRAPPGS